MFARRFFAARMFARRFFPGGLGSSAAAPGYVRLADAAASCEVEDR